MNTENLQENLKYFLTDEVIENQRVFKIVDGTHSPLKEAHVFYTGLIPNKGKTKQDFIAMGKEVTQSYCDWYAKNRNTVKLYYTAKP
ncbi:conserved hypothetical protein [Tenacibaculum maritimum]|uniref:hypothetical protein n=1 Tax=Tenacibaculum maritimum TaxID=107401 RepID=UPI0012E61C57|nr:hypothetical protein [Tenacibaculum maritimum]CAA0177451.1 conserved hypothetical protein [Tenacibaculum maritimum]